MVNADEMQSVTAIRNLLKYTGDVIFDVTIDGVITDAWVRDENIMPWPGRQYTGKRITELNNEQVTLKCMDLVYAAITHRQSGYLEYSSIYDNVFYKFSVRVVPIDPQPGKAFLITENITAKSNVDFGEERWRIALEAAGDGVWDYDIEQNKIFFSKKWYEILGYSNTDISDNPVDWRNKIHPEDLIITDRAYAHLMVGNSQHYHIEFRARCKNGSYKWILSRGIIFTKATDGKPQRIIGTHKDIHDRKLLEESLRLSNDTFSNAFKYSGIGMAIVSPTGRWLDVNNALCKMLGYSKDELLALSFQNVTYPADLDQDMELLKRMLSKEIDTYDMEKRYISKDNKLVYTHLTVSLIWNNDGSPKFFVSQIVNITKRKALIDELGRNNAELQATKISLVNKLNQLEELGYMIAHNLRGPANSIKALIDILKDVDPATEGEIVGLIQDGADSLLGSLDTLMEVAQIKLNKNIPYERCDFEEIINNITRQLNSIIFEKHAVIQLFLQVEEILYPKVYLESILYNLISNSLKYSWENMAPKIIISTSSNNGKVTLSVKDNGIGIDIDKFRKKIFQLNQTFHRGYDSKGVGLFITKSQIESLGGSITVHSEVNKGTEFMVTF